MTKADGRLFPFAVTFLLTPMNTKKLAWSDEIGCEGGPVLVANLDDFEHWRGSDPLDSSRATELHYWSPFTSELPEQWHPSGPTGHQYLASANPSETREKLMSTLLNHWPGTTVDRTDGTWRAIRPDGRILNAALSPDSEYDSATRNLGDDGIHCFGSGAIGYLWSVAPGMAIPLRAAPARVPPVLLCAPANGTVAADSVTLEIYLREIPSQEAYHAAHPDTFHPGRQRLAAFRLRNAGHACGLAGGADRGRRE